MDEIHLSPVGIGGLSQRVSGARGGSSQEAIIELGLNNNLLRTCEESLKTL